MNDPLRLSPSHAREALGLPSAPLLLFTWLAESAWIYLVCLLVVMAGSGRAVTPAVVLFPYGMATAITLLTQWRTIGRATLRTSPDVFGPKPWIRGSLEAVAMTALHLGSGLLTLLAIVWWEMYRQQPLLDTAWIRSSVADLQARQGSGLPPMAWLAILSLFLWWRGIRLGREEIDFPPLVSRFFAATAILVAIAAMGGQLLEAASAGWWLAGYLLFGLAALSVARLEAAKRERHGSVNGEWRWRSPAVALLLMLAGFGAAFLLFPVLMGVAQGLQHLLAGVILPAVLEILKWIAHLLGLDKPPQPLPATPGPEIALPPGKRDLFSLPDWLRTMARQLFDLTWITLILYSLYLSAKRWRLGGLRSSTGGASRERMSRDWKLQLKTALLRILRRLLGRWPWLYQRIGWANTAEERAGTVREIYRRLLRWGEGQGCRRPAWSTPREYCTDLSTAWPPLEADFHTITESYLRSRYGGLPTEKEELSDTLAGWRRVSEQQIVPTHR